MPSCAWRRSPSNLRLLRGEPDVPDEMQPRKDANDIIGHIDLPPHQTMARGSWKGMMGIVPSLTHGKNAHGDVIPAFIFNKVSFLAPQMADRIHAPCYVVDQKEACQAAPDQA